MIESLSASLFVAIVLSLALIKSMVFNSRRLEALGYSLSVLFLQVLIADYEDIFFICPQFPIYISPLDQENTDPDDTIPDPGARGVYVDTALLLARCTRPETNPPVSIASTFATAFRDSHYNPLGDIDITSLEVPILEERKKAPTRHPKDLEEHVESIRSSLASAQKQVVMQARVLFASHKFLGQDMVVLLATAGQYYRIAVVHRDHPVNRVVPVKYDLDKFFKSADADLVMNVTDIEPLFSAAALQKKKLELEKAHGKEEKMRQDKARDERAAARHARELGLPSLPIPQRDQSRFVLSAFEPYTDGMIETYHGFIGNRSRYRHTSFFEPEPLPNLKLSSLGKLRDPMRDQGVVFTGVIRVGTSASDKYIELIRDYLADLAAAERVRRAA